MRLLDRYLRSLQDREEILPGAYERLRTLSRSQTPGVPRSLADMACFLAGPGAQWCTKEGRSALKGQPTEYLLERLDCRPGAAKKLFEAWASDVASASLPTDSSDDRSAAELGLNAAANVLESRFQDYESRGYLRGESFLSPGAQAARRFLSEAVDAGIVSGAVDLDEMANKMIDLGSVGRQEAARRLAMRLETNPAYESAVPVGGGYTVTQVIEWAKETTPALPVDDLLELGGYY